MPIRRRQLPKEPKYAPNTPPERRVDRGAASPVPFTPKRSPNQVIRQSSIKRKSRPKKVSRLLPLPPDRSLDFSSSRYHNSSGPLEFFSGNLSGNIGAETFVEVDKVAGFSHKSTMSRPLSESAFDFFPSVEADRAVDDRAGSDLNHTKWLKDKVPTNAVVAKEALAELERKLKPLFNGISSIISRSNMMQASDIHSGGSADGKEARIFGFCDKIIKGSSGDLEADLEALAETKLVTLQQGRASKISAGSVPENYSESANELLRLFEDFRSSHLRDERFYCLPPAMLSFIDNLPQFIASYAASRINFGKAKRSVKIKLDDGTTASNIKSLKEALTNAVDVSCNQKKLVQESLDSRVEDFIPAVLNPALDKFSSKVDGVDLEIPGDGINVSRHQLNALRDIDNAFVAALREDRPLSGQAAIRMPTGSGKSWLLKKIKDHYRGFRELQEVNLYSSKRDIENLFRIAYGDRKFDNHYISIDENFFLGRNFYELFAGRGVDGLKGSALKLDDPDDIIAIEKAKIDFIRRLRSKGITVLSWGASEEISKVDIEILRQKRKIRALEDGLNAKLVSSVHERRGEPEASNKILSGIEKILSNVNATSVRAFSGYKSEKGNQKTLEKLLESLKKVNKRASFKTASDNEKLRMDAVKRFVTEHGAPENLKALNHKYVEELKSALAAVARTSSKSAGKRGGVSDDVVDEISVEIDRRRKKLESREVLKRDLNATKAVNMGYIKSSHICELGADDAPLDVMGRQREPDALELSKIIKQSVSLVTTGDEGSGAGVTQYMSDFNTHVLSDLSDEVIMNNALPENTKCIVFPILRGADNVPCLRAVFRDRDGVAKNTEMPIFHGKAGDLDAFFRQIHQDFSDDGIVTVYGKYNFIGGDYGILSRSPARQFVCLGDQVGVNSYIQAFGRCRGNKESLDRYIVSNAFEEYQALYESIELNSSKEDAIRTYSYLFAKSHGIEGVDSDADRDWYQEMYGFIQDNGQIGYNHRALASGDVQGIVNNVRDAIKFQKLKLEGAEAHFEPETVTRTWVDGQEQPLISTVRLGGGGPLHFDLSAVLESFEVDNPSSNVLARSRLNIAGAIDAELGTEDKTFSRQVNLETNTKTLRDNLQKINAMEALIHLNALAVGDKESLTGHFNSGRFNDGFIDASSEFHDAKMSVPSDEAKDFSTLFGVFYDKVVVLLHEDNRKEFKTFFDSSVDSNDDIRSGGDSFDEKEFYKECFDLFLKGEKGPLEEKLQSSPSLSPGKVVSPMPRGVTKLPHSMFKDLLSKFAINRLQNLMVEIDYLIPPDSIPGIEYFDGDYNGQYKDTLSLLRRAKDEGAKEAYIDQLRDKLNEIIVSNTSSKVEKTIANFSAYNDVLITKQSQLVTSRKDENDARISAAMRGALESPSSSSVESSSDGELVVGSAVKSGIQESPPNFQKDEAFKEFASKIAIIMFRYADPSSDSSMPVDKIVDSLCKTLDPIALNLSESDLTSFFADKGSEFKKEEGIGKKFYDGNNTQSILDANKRFTIYLHELGQRVAVDAADANEEAAAAAAKEEELRAAEQRRAAEEEERRRQEKADAEALLRAQQEKADAENQARTGQLQTFVALFDQVLGLRQTSALPHGVTDGQITEELQKDDGTFVQLHDDVGSGYKAQLLGLVGASGSTLASGPSSDIQTAILSSNNSGQLEAANAALDQSISALKAQVSQEADRLRAEKEKAEADEALAAEQRRAAEEEAELKRQQEERHKQEELDAAKIAKIVEINKFISENTAPKGEVLDPSKTNLLAYENVEKYLKGLNRDSVPIIDGEALQETTSLNPYQSTTVSLSVTATENFRDKLSSDELDRVQDQLQKMLEKSREDLAASQRKEEERKVQNDLQFKALAAKIVDYVQTYDRDFAGPAGPASNTPFTGDGTIDQLMRSSVLRCDKPERDGGVLENIAAAINAMKTAGDLVDSFTGSTYAKNLKSHLDGSPSLYSGASNHLDELTAYAESARATEKDDKVAAIVEFNKIVAAFAKLVEGGHISVDELKAELLQEDGALSMVDNVDGYTVASFVDDIFGNESKLASAKGLPFNNFYSQDLHAMNKDLIEEHRKIVEQIRGQQNLKEEAERGARLAVIEKINGFVGDRTVASGAPTVEKPCDLESMSAILHAIEFDGDGGKKLFPEGRVLIEAVGGDKVNLTGDTRKVLEVYNAETLDGIFGHIENKIATERQKLALQTKRLALETERLAAANAVIAEINSLIGVNVAPARSEVAPEELLSIADVANFLRDELALQDGSKLFPGLKDGDALEQNASTGRMTLSGLVAGKLRELDPESLNASVLGPIKDVIEEAIRHVADRGSRSSSDEYILDALSEYSSDDDSSDEEGLTGGVSAAPTQPSPSVFSPAAELTPDQLITKACESFYSSTLKSSVLSAKGSKILPEQKIAFKRSLRKGLEDGGLKNTSSLNAVIEYGRALGVLNKDQLKIEGESHDSILESVSTRQGVKDISQFGSKDSRVKLQELAKVVKDRILELNPCVADQIKVIADRIKDSGRGRL